MRIKIPRNSKDLLGIGGICPTEVSIGFYLLSYQSHISFPLNEETLHIKELIALVINGRIDVYGRTHLRE